MLILSINRSYNKEWHKGYLNCKFYWDSLHKRILGVLIPASTKYFFTGPYVTPKMYWSKCHVYNWPQLYTLLVREIVEYATVCDHLEFEILASTLQK